ncbi:MAG: hypothetical protein MUO19_01610, partial [Dehalococcoidales bacterium]|nr:hypothetical protein [Dehalococcoidales bacterium]
SSETFPQETIEKPLMSFIQHSNHILPNTVNSNEKFLAGKIFVITGRLDSFSRPEAEARIKALGGTAKSSVTKKTDYVVAGAESGSKAVKAEKLGITQLTEEEFLTMIGQK